MYTPSYLSVKRSDEKNRTTFVFQANVLVCSVFIVLFTITGLVGFSFAFAGTDNPAYGIVGIVSVITVLAFCFYRSLSVILTVDSDKGILTLCKKILTFQYRGTQLSLTGIESVTYEKKIQYMNGTSTPKSYLFLVGGGDEILLFTGDSALKLFGEDLAKELNTQFVEKL